MDAFNVLRRCTRCLAIDGTKCKTLSAIESATYPRMDSCSFEVIRLQDKLMMYRPSCEGRSRKSNQLAARPMRG